MMLEHPGRTMTQISADLKIELGPIEQLGVARGPKGTSVVRITSKMTFSRGGLTWVRPVETFVLVASDGNMLPGQYQRREDADDKLKQTDGPEGDGPEGKYEKDEFELENPMDIDRAKEGIPSILEHDKSGSLLHGHFSLSVRGVGLPNALVLEPWG